MDNFENSNDTDSSENIETETEKTIAEAEEPKAADFKIDANDNEYKQNSCPDGPYEIDPSISEAEDYGESFANEFGKAAKEVKLSQRKHDVALKFWNDNIESFAQDSFGENFKQTCKQFAIKNDFTEEEHGGLMKFVAGYVKNYRSQLEQINKFSRQSHGTVNISASARKQQILNSPEYKNRGTTPAEKRAHKAVCNEFLALCRE